MSANAQGSSLLRVATVAKKLLKEKEALRETVNKHVTTVLIANPTCLNDQLRHCIALKFKPSVIAKSRT